VGMMEMVGMMMGMAMMVVAGITEC